MARVPARVGELLLAVKARPDESIADVSAGLGLTVPQAAAVLRAVAAIPGVAQAPARLRLVQFRPPLTVQFTLIDPSRLLRRDALVCRAVRSRLFWPVMVALNVLGGLAVAAAVVLPTSLLHTPISLQGYLWLIAGMLASMFLHELAHAVTLTAHGGRSTRMGFMFFYLMPAFFCDVRDSWSLPPRKRVEVALAGVAVQGAVAAVTAAASLVVAPEAGVVLIAIAFFNVLYWAVNLIPFIKLDGYVALAGALDRPHLRDHAVAAFRAAVRRALGMSTDPAARATVGLTVFGAACALFPMLVVTGAVVGLASSLSALGQASHWLVLVLVGALTIWAATRIWHSMRESVSRGDSPGRLAAGWGLAVLAAVGVATLVPLPQAGSAGVFVRDGRAQLAVLSGAHLASIGDQTLIVRAPGLLQGAVLAEASLDGAFTPCEIPLAAAVPVADAPYHLNGWCAPLAGDIEGAVTAAPDGAGSVVLRLAPRTLAQWFAAEWESAVRL